METSRKCCRACNQVKPLTEYYKAGNYLQANCKPCHNSYTITHRRNKPKKPKQPRPRKPRKPTKTSFQKLPTEVQKDILNLLGTMTHARLARKHTINPNTFRTWLKNGHIVRGN